MNLKRIIIGCIVLLATGFIIFAQSSLHFSYFKSNHNSKLESKWNNYKSISRLNNSNETILYKEVNVIVTFNEKVLGDTSATHPLIIDITNNELNIENGPFSKTCKIEFLKEFQQKFEAETDLTRIKANVKGKIKYKLDYRIKGICKLEKAKQLITERMMLDIYDEAKKKIKFGLPYFSASNDSIFKNGIHSSATLNEIKKNYSIH